MNAQSMPKPANISVSADASAKANTKSKKSASAFRTISEVANDLEVQQHVLRFWETKFSQVRPLKRGGGRRYYRPEDVVLLQKIHHLLYTEGYTIKGVQKLLREVGKNQIIEGNLPKPAAKTSVSAQSSASPAPQAQASQGGLNSKQRSTLEAMLNELKELRAMVKAEG